MCLGTWFSSRGGSVGLMVRLNDLKDLLQPKCFYRCVDAFMVGITLKATKSDGTKGVTPSGVWVLAVTGLFSDLQFFTAFDCFPVLEFGVIGESCLKICF